MLLISMKDFVLQVCKSKSKDHIDELGKLRKLYAYAQLLSRKLELWMFVPCDEKNMPLKKPIFPTGKREPHDGLAQLYDVHLEQYQKAQERVLFKECELRGNKGDKYRDLFHKNDAIGYTDIENSLCRSSLIIEDLVKHNIKLTETAIKGLNI